MSSSKRPQRVVITETGEVLDPKTSPDYYTLDAIRNAAIWTPENIRQEYSRLYKIVSQRIRVIGKSEIGRQSKTYYYNKDKFKPVSQLKPYEQKLLLVEAAKMIQAKTGTLGGIKEYRKKAIQTLHKHEITFVNEKNFNAFGQFMAWWKDSRFRGYGSETAVDAFESLERASETVDRLFELSNEFDFWQAYISNENQKTRARYGLGSGKELSSAELLNMLDVFLEL